MPIAQWLNASKRYRNSSAYALVDFNLSIDRGEIVVIVGPNGSGKTTAMEMLSGLRVPTSGDVMFRGERVRDGASRGGLGVQLQEAGLPLRIRVREAVRAVASLYRDPGDVDEILRRIGLLDWMPAMVETLSGGWQRRLDIALACIGRPEMLVLDEPTSGLDPVARAEIWEFLREWRGRGVAVLASTHDLTEAEAFADRLVVLHHGQVVLEGPVEEVLNVAGGRWRVKILGVGHGLDAFHLRSGQEFYRSGENLTVLGSREEMTALHHALIAAQDAGEVGYRDLLVGPVRLEDVFSSVVGKVSQ